MNKITIFVKRLEKIGIDINLVINYVEMKRCYSLGEKLGYGNIRNMADEIRAIRSKSLDILNLKPVAEGRDNKGIKVGGGSGNKNMVRYPSKKRSRRTWSNFYKLFPMLAKSDEWDGKKSNKM